MAPGAPPLGHAPQLPHLPPEREPVPGLRRRLLSRPESAHTPPGTAPGARPDPSSI